jgi:predicted transcriptional regulator YdeE
MNLGNTFTVIGVEQRTQNAREMSGQGIIPQLWARVMGESLLSTIPGRADDCIVAVYSGYTSDKDGEYDYLLGAKVAAPSATPEGMVARQVALGHYEVFSGDDSSPETVVGLWKKIWAQKKELRRAYVTDFEIYYPDQRVEIYIGLAGLAGNERTAPVEIPPSTNKV